MLQTIGIILGLIMWVCIIHYIIQQMQFTQEDIIDEMWDVDVDEDGPFICLADDEKLVFEDDFTPPNKE